jgi:hypothetical protein
LLSHKLKALNAKKLQLFSNIAALHATSIAVSDKLLMPGFLIERLEEVNQ